MIEAMEPRRLLAGPQVVAMTILGSEEEVTGVVLTFSGALDPASAQVPEAYFIGRQKTSGGDKFWDPLNLSDPPKETQRVRLRSAVYDPAANTVALTPAATFSLFDKFRKLRVSGRGGTAVKDAAGAPIDGDGNGTPGGNEILKVRVTRTKRFQFKEGDGDRAKLRLHGPGELWAVVSKQRQFPPIIFLNRTNALTSGLTGRVTPNRRTGDGAVTLRQISGVTFASVPLLADPAFRVEAVIP